MAVTVVQDLGTVAAPSTPGGFANSANFDLEAPSDVTSGNVIVLKITKLQIGLSSPVVVANITKLGGTATIGTVVEDASLNYNYSGSNNNQAAIFSIPITGSGSLQLRVANTEYVAGVASEYSGLGTAEDSSTGSGASGNQSSGNVTTAGAGLIVGVQSNTSNNSSDTPDGAFTEIYAQESSLNERVNAIRQIVATGTTDSADWTAGSSNPWVAAAVAYAATGGASVGLGPLINRSFAVRRANNY